MKKVLLSLAVVFAFVINANAQFVTLNEGTTIHVSGGITNNSYIGEAGVNVNIDALNFGVKAEVENLPYYKKLAPNIQGSVGFNHILEENFLLSYHLIAGVRRFDEMTQTYSHQYIDDLYYAPYGGAGIKLGVKFDIVTLGLMFSGVYYGHKMEIQYPKGTVVSSMAHFMTSSAFTLGIDLTDNVQIFGTINYEYGGGNHSNFRSYSDNFKGQLGLAIAF